MDSTQSSPSRTIFQPPLGRWVAAAVKDLPRKTARRLRTEYHAHFADAMERSLATTRCEEDAVEEVLRSLGDADDARRELNRVHVTKSDLRFIDKLIEEKSARRRPWRLAGSAFFALVFIPQWIHLIAPLSWPAAAPSIAAIAVWLAFGAWDELSSGSPKARLAIAAQLFPQMILVAALLYASILKGIVLVFFSVICARIAFHSFRASRILRKMKRLERLPDGDPAIRA